jgi:hypothetical protein
MQKKYIGFQSLTIQKTYCLLLQKSITRSNHRLQIEKTDATPTIAISMCFQRSTNSSANMEINMLKSNKILYSKTYCAIFAAFKAK